MTPIAREDFRAAAEPEPAIAFAVVAAAASAGQLLARDDAEGFLGFLAHGGEVVARRGADEEEFHFGDLEGEFAVAGAADG